MDHETEVAMEVLTVPRKRAQPNRYQSVVQNNHSYNWSPREKTTLLNALKKYGHLDLQNLCRAVPSKNKEQIKIFITMSLKAARNSLRMSLKEGRLGKIPMNTILPYSERKKPVKPSPFFVVDNDCKPLEKVPLDMWLHKLEEAQPIRNYNEVKKLPIARAFLYISKFEKHPDPAHCNGVDFRALYEFLHNMLLGYPTKALSPPTAKLVMESLQELSLIVKVHGMEKEVAFLEGVRRVTYTEVGKVRQYRGPKRVPNVQQPPSDLAESCMKKLLRVKGFNPLRVPVNILKKNL